MKMDIAMLAAAAVFAVAATGCRTVPITGRTQAAAPFRLPGARS